MARGQESERSVSKQQKGRKTAGGLNEGSTSESPLHPKSLEGNHLQEIKQEQRCSLGMFSSRNSISFGNGIIERWARAGGEVGIRI
jgi:hypothetical protein